MNVSGALGTMSPLRIVVLYSTKDSLGAKLAARLKSLALGNGDTREFTGFDDLADVIKNNPAHVYVIVAHGDNHDHKLWGSDDLNWEGESLGISAPELGLILAQLTWTNCVVLMGCCFSGTDDLLESLKRSGVSAVVAPSGADTISAKEILDNYGTFIQKLATNKVGLDNSDLVPVLMRESFSDSFKAKALIWPK